MIFKHSDNYKITLPDLSGGDTDTGREGGCSAVSSSDLSGDGGDTDSGEDGCSITSSLASILNKLQ